MNPLKPILAILLTLSLAVMHNSVNADGSEGVTAATETGVPNLWIVKEGKHTSLILRTADTTNALPLAEAKAAAGPLVMISWGDAAYYQTADKTLALTLKALFLPTRAALNARSLQSLNEAPQTRAKAKLYPLMLDARDLQKILHRIASTLDTNGTIQSNGLLAGATNNYVGGRFYPALDRRYSMLFTCNSWVADVLKAGDLHFSSLSSQTAGNLILQHKVSWLLSSRYREQSQFDSIPISKIE